MVVMNTSASPNKNNTEHKPFFSFFLETKRRENPQTKPNQTKPSQSTLIKPYLTKQTPQPSPRTVVKSSRMT